MFKETLSNDLLQLCTCTNTFALEAFFSQDADQGQELCDLFKVQHGRVVEFDDRHRLLVVGAAAAVFPQARVGNEKKLMLEKSWNISNKMVLLSLQNTDVRSAALTGGQH